MNYIFKSNRHTNQRTSPANGFTIVEILVVIAVIGILVTIGAFAYNNAQKNSRDQKRTSDIAVLKSALEKYYDTNGEYPSGCSIGGTYPTCLVSEYPYLLTTSGQVSIFDNRFNAAQLSDILGTKLTDTFGDPKTPANIMPLQVASGTNAPYGYFYMGGFKQHPGYGSLVKTYGLTSLTLTQFGCSSINFTLDGATGEGATYIVGYYNELNKQWVYSTGQHGQPFTTSDASPSCTLPK